MRRQLNRDRLQISSWYTGAGNKPSVFTRKYRRPFEKLKESYQNQLKVKAARTNEKLDELSEHERMLLRKAVRKDMRNDRYRMMIIAVASLLGTVGVLFLLVELIKLVFF